MEESSLILNSEDNNGLFQDAYECLASFIMESHGIRHISSAQMVQAFYNENALTPPPTIAPSTKQESNAGVNRNLRLGFYHNCSTFGCGENNCTLCEQNPLRRCRQDFCKKYLVRDILKANCKQDIYVGIYDGDDRIENYDTSNITFEILLLNGSSYKAQAARKSILNYQDLTLCIEKDYTDDSPILESARTSSSYGDSVRVFVTGNKGSFCLPELKVMRSSESYLKSRRPPYVLAVVAFDSMTKIPIQDIEHVVSSEFIVATRRVKGARKSETPMMSEDVGKINNIGKETQKKLKTLGNLYNASFAPHIFKPVGTVGAFYNLAREMEEDETLKRYLISKLNLSIDKWTEARDHVFRAVGNDSRIRLWTKEEEGRHYGLAFLCNNAVIDFSKFNPPNYIYFEMMPDRPVFYDPRKSEYSQRTRISSLIKEAQKDWQKINHPNWSFCFEGMNDEGIKSIINNLNSNHNG